MAGIDSRELTEWQAFYQLEPFGWKASLFGPGMVSATLMNILTKHKDKGFRPGDMIHYYAPEDEAKDRPERAVKDPRDIYEMFKRIARQQGKKVKR